MNRKQRRSEKFGHFSENRHLHQVQQYYHGIQTDVYDAQKEMQEDVRTRRIDNYFSNKPPYNIDNIVLPQFEYRYSSFLLTH